MAKATAQTVQQGFSQTCWHGMHFSHPSDWEPAILSGPNEPARCTLADRRYQRLQLYWQVLKQPPDLAQMYEQLRRSHKDHPVSRLTGPPGWFGLVRKEPAGEVLHAGRYFQDKSCLVQAVFTWPGGRDAELERSVLESVAPQGQADPLLWQALGLSTSVPAAFTMVSARHLVGRIEWEFRRPGRPAAGLTVVRVGMSGHWLKEPLNEWLAGQQPKGFRVVRACPVNCGGHPGAELVSLRGGLLRSLAGRGDYRLDRAWNCSDQGRVYWLTYRQRSAVEVDWPAQLEVNCCRRVRLASGGS